MLPTTNRRLTLLQVFVKTALVASALISFASSAEAAEKFALIIANQDYKYVDKLDTPLNDAEAFEDVLVEKFGFRRSNITRLANKKREWIIREFEDLIEKLKYDDSLIIYYAGHGVLHGSANDKENQTGYWLPIDARKSDPSTWVSNDAILQVLKQAKAKHVAVISDSCFSGSIHNEPQQQTRGWSRSQTTEDASQRSIARVALTSGFLQKVLDGGGADIGDDMEHSIFASVLLSKLSQTQSDLTFNVLGTDIETAFANHKQKAIYSPLFHAGHNGGMYVFNVTDENASSTGTLANRDPKARLPNSDGGFLDEIVEGISGLVDVSILSPSMRNGIGLDQLKILIPEIAASEKEELRENVFEAMNERIEKYVRIYLEDYSNELKPLLRVRRLETSMHHSDLENLSDYAGAQNLSALITGRVTEYSSVLKGNEVKIEGKIIYGGGAKNKIDRSYAEIDDTISSGYISNSLTFPSIASNLDESWAEQAVISLSVSAIDQSLAIPSWNDTEMIYSLYCALGTIQNRQKTNSGLLEDIVALRNQLSNVMVSKGETDACI